MNQIPELLSPAGGPRQLRAAVENGADAVYMGGQLFNARVNAENFTEDSMEEAMEYAHMRGVKIYAAMNTLLRDQELPSALEQAARMYESGADAIIVQDLGLGSLLKRYFPEIPLHLSTQGTIYNAEGVRKAAELGFSRVVLAREMSLDEIRTVTAAADTDVEVFVHGALCMCYSGQCHLSRAIGGRSGNRGACAQPCRLGYDICRGDSGYGGLGQERRAADKGKTACDLELVGSGYLLSPKDLCAIDHLGALCQAGVASLKIEGRMKSPEYVAVVTGIYRKYLDRYAEKGAYRVSEEDRLDLRQIFSRGEFTSGYMMGNPGKSLLSGRLPKHQGIFVGKVTAYHPERRTVSLRWAGQEGGEKLALGDGIEIHGKELAGNVITYRKGDEIGYLSGRIRPGDPVYKITDKALMERARASYEARSGAEKKARRKREVSMELYLRPGQPARLKLKSGEIEAEVRSREPVEPAVNRPLTVEGATKQLEKTGETPFRPKEISTDLGPAPVSVKISTLNELRRRGLELLEQQLRQEQKQSRRLEEKRVEATRIVPAVFAGSERREGIGDDAPRLSYYLFAADQEMLVLARTEEREIPGFGRLPVSRYYLPYELFFDPAYEKELDALRGAGKETVPFLPAVTRGQEDFFIRNRKDELLALARRYGLSVGNPGHVALFAAPAGEDSMRARGDGKEKIKLYGDFGLNLYNSAALRLAAEMGLTGAALSNEALSRRRDNGSGEEPAGSFDFRAAAEAAAQVGLELEAAAGGTLPLMISAHCPVGDAGKECPGRSGGEGRCRGGRYYLRDRKSKLYPIVTRKGDCQVLIFQDEPIEDRRFIGKIAESGGLNLRFYGIDKKIFCNHP